MLNLDLSSNLERKTESSQMPIAHSRSTRNIYYTVEWKQRFLKDATKAKYIFCTLMLFKPWLLSLLHCPQGAHTKEIPDVNLLLRPPPQLVSHNHISGIKILLYFFFTKVANKTITYTNKRNKIMTKLLPFLLTDPTDIGKKLFLWP